MTPNFQFLETEFKNFFDRALKAKKIVITVLRASLIYSRMVLESGMNWINNTSTSLNSALSTSNGLCF